MRKMISVVAIIAIVFSILTFGTLVSASSDGAINRKALAVRGPLSVNGSWAIQDCNIFYSAMIRNSIPSHKYVFSDNDIDYLEEEMTEYFNGSDDDDFNYLYFAGHGSEEGIALGCFTLYSDIKNITDEIPGHFIIFFDCCESGGAINRNDSFATRNDVNEQIVIQNFLGDLRSFENTAKYTVYCSSQSNQASYCGDYSEATSLWMKGLGLDASTYSSCSLNADYNNDSIVTAKELQDYITIHSTPNDNSDPCYFSQYYFETICTSDYVLGDVNRDGIIAMADILMTMRYINGLENLSLRQIQLADVSGDGYITDTDKVYIQKYVARQSI